MGRRPRVERTPEEKWQIVQEGLRTGTSQRRAGGMALHRHYYIDGKTKRRQERRQRLGGEALLRAKPTKDQRIRQLERTLGRKSLEIGNPKKTSWGSELRCGSFPGARDGDARLHSHVGSGNSGHQPVESLLPEAATRQPCRSAVRPADRHGVRENLPMDIAA